MKLFVSYILRCYINVLDIVNIVFNGCIRGIIYDVTRAGSNYKKLNQLQLLSMFQFNYNYTSKIFKSITIAPFQLHLYYAEPFVNYVACVADCVYE